MHIFLVIKLPRVPSFICKLIIHMHEWLMKCIEMPTIWLSFHCHSYLHKFRFRYSFIKVKAVSPYPTSLFNKYYDLIKRKYIVCTLSFTGTFPGIFVVILFKMTKIIWMLMEKIFKEQSDKIIVCRSQTVDLHVLYKCIYFAFYLYI